MSIAFPNVPFVKGVPQIARSPKFSYATQSYLGLAESYVIDTLFPKPKWGVYTKGNNEVFGVDNIVSVAYKKENRVSNFPVEQGNFASYNKVAMPYTSVLRMTKGGSVSERASVLKKLETAVGSTNTYIIITPEGSYVNANIVSFDYTRTSYLLTVDVYIQEIKQVVPSYNKVDNTASPASSSTVSNGISQPSTATSTQSTAFSANTTTAVNYLASANAEVTDWMKKLF